MRCVIFCHSLRSAWNHGNAHFLWGICAELIRLGHEVIVYEPRDGWSRQNLLADHGPDADTRYHRAYPQLNSRLYDPHDFSYAQAIAGAGLVLVHEWNDTHTVSAVGEAHENEHDADRVLLFHDTHHRSITAPEQMRRYDLRHYDGVLAFGEVIRQWYHDHHRRRAWTWHEAADHRVFKPMPDHDCEGDLVWIGNWGDDERTAELHTYLIEPVRRLRLRAKVFGVRYPEEALRSLRDAGIVFGGYLPNHYVPEVYARYRVTVHVPRGPYAKQLPGVPTVRPFEALACGIPLISAPWQDTEGLFRPGRDLLMADSTDAMTDTLRRVLHDQALRRSLIQHGRETVLARHTCAHRVSQLLEIAHAIRQTHHSPTTQPQSIRSMTHAS